MIKSYSTNGKKRNVYRMLEEKPEGRRPLGRPRHKGVNNIIKMVLGEGGGESFIDWTGFQYRDK
jgi:hypothetical protein